MRRIVLLAAVVVALAGRGHAQTVTYYLHKSPSPVTIPGGTTVFTLDEAAPAASTPVAESVSAPKGSTQSFPTFVAPTFAAPVTLGMDFDVTVFASANLAMNNNCASFNATIDRIDSGGIRLPLAHGSARATVPQAQGGSGGTVGFVPVVVPLGVGCDRPTDDVTFQVGESIAVTVSVTNVCKANRTVFLAYDAVPATATATFAPTPPPDEAFLRACYAKCQQSASKAIAKFVGAKNKCVLKCVANARKGLSMISECYAPYGGFTASCIADPLNGAEAKTVALVQHACVQPNRCPPCYSAGDCTTHSIDMVADFEGAFDSFGPGIFCDNPSVPDQQKCIDNTSKALWKQFASRERCYDKCYASEGKGAVAPNSCDPPATDLKTMACLELARSKSAAAIDKYCAPAGHSPTCGGSPYPTGAAWSSLIDLAVDSFIPSTYCGD